MRFSGSRTALEPELWLRFKHFSGRPEFSAHVQKDGTGRKKLAFKLQRGKTGQAHFAQVWTRACKGGSPRGRSY